MRRTLILGLVLCPAALQAETVTCVFETECLPGEACQSTTYDLSVTSNGDQYTLSDINGDTPVARQETALGTLWSGASDFGFHFLSATADGADYSLHIEGFDGAISYSGACEIS